MDDQKFKSAFQNLTGYPPLRWQVRLFRDYFAKNELPAVVNLPTGLGKTMVMAIWLIAREVNKQLPRRLIYVVDRRTVIDQATDWACKLRANSTANGEATIAISTLRGQLADNREWSRDMSRPAIIIGTVDLVGSGLLFSGYRSSFKRRPLEAGLLGQDSLLVLDEAHLSKPFEKLIKSISRFQNGHGSPMKVVRMSATSGDSDGELVFRLDTDPNSRTYDLQPDPDPDTGDERNHIITRFNAKKSLSTTTTDKVIDQLATVAGELESSHPASRIVIFVKTPKQVDDVRKALIKKDNTREPRIAQLTGTMRGLERDTLVTQPDDPTQHARAVMQRFVNPENDPSLGECFLISTSAGEVGFDLNADHMVCDEAPLDSMIQRLGRVNRRGLGEAEVHLIRQSDPKPKTDFDKACIAAADLFETELREDVSPQAIANLRVKLSPHTLQLDILAVDDAAYAAHREGRISAVIRAANTPVPTTVELTDILLDAWSMTSITEKMPGRPDVAPWLRGISEEVAQTTIVWRAELDLLADSPDAEMALKPIFAKHRVRPHESLTTNSKHVLQFLKDVVKDRPELNERPVAIKFTRDIFVKSLADLIDNPGPLFASDPTLILPVNVGGLNEAGMLDSSAVSKTPSDNDPIPKRLDVADQPGYEQREDATPRLRLIVHRTDEGNWVPESIHADVAIPEWLGPSYSTSTKLFDALRKQRFRIRHVQPIELDNEGSPKRSLVLLSPVANKNVEEDQSLMEHVGAVEREAERIVKALRLEENDPIRTALLFAARWHDEGKKAPVWQRFVYADGTTGQFKGKSSKTRGSKSLGGYRHEFGSLMYLTNGTDCELPTDPDARDLALHLIATHHGCARPHFSTPLDRRYSTADCNAVRADTIRRFASLQRKFGWWLLAWLENLLRCADSLASADQDSEDDPNDASTE